MPPKTIKSSLKIGEIIMNRRNELNLTIEEAALKSGLGTKTRSRYESGASIRRDKVKGICKTLKWKTIPETDDDNIIDDVDFNEYRKSKTWSPFLEEHYGNYAALSFDIGSAILLDGINDDLAALSEMPRGSHIGEIPSSLISTIMPGQFLVRYDYEFMFALRQTLIWFRKNAPHTNIIIAHRVIDELVLYLIEEESESFLKKWS
jgi:transcriptional regulator with XRE-family HTH domain